MSPSPDLVAALGVPAPAVLAWLTLAAFAAGLVDAVAGGGGLVTLPALLAAGLPVPVALATNKGQSVFGSATALAGFWRAGRIDSKRVALPLALGFVGAVGGAWLVTTLEAAVLKPLVLGLLVAVALFLAMRRDFGNHERQTSPVTHARIRVAVVALALGSYDGFFGPGTGTFLIMAHVLWLGDAMTTASAHAKVINFASNLAALTLFVLAGRVLWAVALPMAVGQMAGAAFGTRLAVRGGDRFVRGVVLAVVIALAGPSQSPSP